MYERMYIYVWFPFCTRHSILITQNITMSVYLLREILILGAPVIEIGDLEIRILSKLPNADSHGLKS